MNRLDANNISYTYRSKSHTVTALDNISYCFESGKMYVIVGKSGSGKTTLLSALAGLDKPEKGTITLNGKDISEIDNDEYRLKHVSVIYQSFNLLPFLTAVENITLPLEFMKISASKSKEIAAEKLLSVGLLDTHFKRLPSMLSGGEQQRVAIARGLATKTGFILADEPTGNLDTANSEKIVGLLKKLVKDEGLGVIMVTHDLAIAEQADRVIRISDGCIAG